MAEPRYPRTPADRDVSFRYPFEALRDRYLTPFGGTSFDLQPFEIGVNAKALKANTTLDPTRDRVLVTSEMDSRKTPLIAKPFYTIVPLTEERAEALDLSPNGEAVFSCYELDAHDHERSVVHALHEGAPVTLNAVLSRRWPTPANKWEDLFRLNNRNPL